MMWGGSDAKPLAMQGTQKEEDLQKQEEIPLFMDPILAWRCWHVEYDERRGILLRSITHTIRWPKRKPARAHCMAMYKDNMASPKHNHDAPDMTHGCGFYAVDTPQDCVAWTKSSYRTLRAIGRVKLWGQVFDFTKGYLAEYAYPLEMWLPTTWQGIPPDKLTSFEDRSAPEIAFMLADAYGIQVHDAAELEIEL